MSHKRKLSALEGDFEFNLAKYQQFDDTPIVKQTTTTTMPGRYAASYYPRKRKLTRFFKKRFFKKKFIKKSLRGFVRNGGYYGRYNNGESKFFEDTQDVSTITTAGIIAYISLNRIAQGVTEVTRVGRKCVLTQIHLRGFITYASQTTLAAMSEIFRVIVFLDTQANGATATVTDILETADEKSFNNLANSQRFRIFDDKYMTFNSNTMTALAGPVYASGQQQIKYEFHKKCNIPLEFSGTTGAITEIRSNNVGVLVICGVTTASHSWFATSRVRFTDG